MPAMPPPTTTTFLPATPALASARVELLLLDRGLSSSAQPAMGSKPVAMPPAAQPTSWRRDMTFALRLMWFMESSFVCYFKYAAILPSCSGV